VPILVADEVLSEAGVAPEPADEADEVEQFREFLDTVTPQDFQ
jgi:bifunctional DNase/RNase